MRLFTIKDLETRISMSIDALKLAYRRSSCIKVSIGLLFYGRSFAYASGLNESHHGANMNNWLMDERLPQYFNIVDRLSSMISVHHDVSKEIECCNLSKPVHVHCRENYGFFLCHLLTWNYQEDEECLRVVFKEAEQQQEEEEKRLRIGAEETEPA